MKCSRCAAELPDSSTFCSTCGAANPSGQLTTSSFSYLPAGAPPWPASAPGRYPYGASSPALVQLTAPRLTEKAGRTMGRTILTFALIVLITLLVGVGSTLGVLASQGHFSAHPAAATKKAVAVPTQTQATPASTSTAQGNQLPAATSFKLTSVKDVNAALEYPSSWVQDALQKSTNATSLSIHTPQQGQIVINFSVTRYTDSLSATVTSPEVINQSIAQQFGQQNSLTNQQTIPSTGSPPTIGGTTWSELETSYLTSSSNKIDLMTVSVLHGKDYYNIFVFAPDSYYTEAIQKYIQHMFTTFKFLS